METKNNDVLGRTITKPNNQTFLLFLLVGIIFSSEVFVVYYLQSSIASDISANYVAKSELSDLFKDILISDDHFRSVLRLIVREDSSDSYNRRKRDALVDDDNTVTSHSQIYGSTVKEGQTVEFFNPKLRHELEAKDDVERARTGMKGAAPGGDSWVWLTSYCRIPVNNIIINLG